MSMNVRNCPAPYGGLKAVGELARPCKAAIAKAAAETPEGN